MSNIVRWRPLLDPFEDMDRMMNEFMGSPHQARGFTPALDIYQNDNEVVIEAPLPGINPDNVSVSIENDVLTIEGSVEKKSEVDEKNYYRKEVSKGSFHRTVGLPASVDSDAASADYKDGVLKITVPKAERAKPKTIEVKKS